MEFRNRGISDWLFVHSENTTWLDYSAIELDIHPGFTVDVGNITDSVLFVSLLDREIADTIMLQWWLEFPFLLLALLWGRT
ncbi:MAG: hypothetical protein ACQET3_11025 [Promethearchaeati archaeon]